jgi:hypothetical protein
MPLGKYSWPKKSWGVFPTILVFGCIISADSVQAQRMSQLSHGFQPSIKPYSIPENKVEGQSSLRILNFQVSSLETLNNEQAIRETIPDIQFSPEEMHNFETTAESLQGIEIQLNQDYFWQQSAMGVPEVPLELLDVKAAAAERRETVSEDGLIDDNNPEPVSEPLINFSADVAGTPDELVQWRATLWGGVMTNNDLGETLTARNLVFEDSGFLGAGFSRTLAGGNSIKLEGEIQIFQHAGQQGHLEGTAALSLRWELSHSFSLAIIEGVSYATALPEIEGEKNSQVSQFLNYLAFEVEYTYRPGWALAGRLHHRSGANGLYGNVDGGSNAYLMGIRYRF